MVARGDLPVVSRHLLEAEGGGITPATTVFPSTTVVAYLPFLTGCHPATCDIPGIRWLDPACYAGRWWRDRAHLRSYCGHQGALLNRDLGPGIRSLFDLEPDSAAICSPFLRGLRRGRALGRAARTVLGGIAHYTGRYGALDPALGRALVRLATEPPRFTFAVFPGLDGVTHFFDPWHPKVLAAYRGMDEILGGFARAGGFDGNHLTLVVSDHGLSPVVRHTDLAVALEARGVRTLAHPIVWRRRPDVAVMVSGNGSAQVYLRPGTIRSTRYDVEDIEREGVPGVPLDLVRWLAELPGIGLIAGTDGSDVVVLNRQGRARVRRESDGLITYAPEGADPLAVGGRASLDEREWLERTHDGPWPDAPVQLLLLFRSRRAGDLVVIAAPGADLRDRWEAPEHRSGHGSLHGDHMRCLVAGNRAWRGPIRTTDLFPLVLTHLGHAVPAGIDGVEPDRAPTESRYAAGSSPAASR